MPMPKQPNSRRDRPRPIPKRNRPLGQVVEQGDALGDAQRLVPRHDHRGRADVDVRRAAGDVGQPLGVVGAERVVVEVVLDGPHDVEAELVGEQGETGVLGRTPARR